MLVLDSRAATLEKLGLIKEALLDAKDMVELAPEAHKVRLVSCDPARPNG